MLLLIHGNMNSSKHWDLLLENLDPRYKVYAVDLRGFGISTYHQPIEDLTDFARDVKMFTDALGLASFHLAGWSTGGGIAMQFAADYPEQVRKLILLASMSTRGYPFYHDNHANTGLLQRAKTREEIYALRKTNLVVEAGERRDKEFMRTLFNGAVYPHRQPSPERYEEYLDDILTQRNLADVYHGLNVFNISEVDHEAAKGSGAVKLIQAKTLVLWGKDDLVISEQMTREILEDLGALAKPVLLEQCGHSPLIDQLPLLLEQINCFLQEEQA